MTVVHAGGDAEWPLRVSRNPEFIPHQGGASGLNRVVIGHGMDGRDLVIVDKLAGEIHRPVGEAVRASIQHAIGLQVTTVIDILPGGVLYQDLDPCLVKIAHFGNQRVANVLVLDDDVGLDHVVWLQPKGHGAKGRDHCVLARLFQRENIDVEESAPL